jgi:hypothetical protein
MNGGKLIREQAEDIELSDITARALSRKAEVVVVAAHAVYKEHVVLLMDCLVAWSWMNRGFGAWQRAWC